MPRCPRRTRHQRLSLLRAKQKAVLPEAEARTVVTRSQGVGGGRMERLDEGDRGAAREEEQHGMFYSMAE